jgi:hypothetical protein
MAASFGLYLEKDGITDRATVIIDKDGIVCYAASVTPSGRRDPAALAAECENVDGQFGKGLSDFQAPAGIPAGTVLYVKSRCGVSRATLLARDNLHIRDSLPTSNVTDDAAAREALVKVAGKDQAPCLVTGGNPLHEGAGIIRFMAEAATDLAG